MTILPRIRIRYGENIGVEIFVSPPDINENEKTSVTTDAASGVSSYSVDNGLKFAIGEYIVVGRIGSNKTEINRIHTSTPTTSTTITLTGANTFAHNRGEVITSIPYNQVIIQKSTDGGSTYSDLVTIDIRVDSTETYYADTTGSSTDYYRVKFYNSASTGESAVSDGIIATGFVDGTVGQIIRSALLSLGETIDGELLTKEFLLQALHEGREEIDNNENVARWSFRIVTDYDLGDIIPGRYTVAVTTTLIDPSTYKNILSLRLGSDNIPVIPTDRSVINSYYQGVAHSTLNGSITNASTSIILTSSGDFTETGSVDIAAESISGTIDNAAYTSNTESSATISGVTSIADSHSSGRDVWQGATFGLPLFYTVENGTITFSQPFSDDFSGQNIKIDFYSKLVRADSDGDTLDEPWASNVYIPYLRWRIKKRKDPSLKQDEDSDYKEYLTKSTAQVNKEFNGQDLRIDYDF